MARESQGEEVPFHLGQGMSGKLAVVSGKIALFSYCRSGGRFKFLSLWKLLFFQFTFKVCPLPIFSFNFVS